MLNELEHCGPAVQWPPWGVDIFVVPLRVFPPHATTPNCVHPPPPVFLLDPLGFGDFLPVAEINENDVDCVPGHGSHLGTVPSLIIVKLTDETFTQA